MDQEVIELIAIPKGTLIKGYSLEGVYSEPPHVKIETGDGVFCVRLPSHLGHLPELDLTIVDG